MDREKKIEQLVALTAEVRAVIVAKVTNRESTFREDELLKDLVTDVIALARETDPCLPPPPAAPTFAENARANVMKDLNPKKDSRDEIPF